MQQPQELQLYDIYGIYYDPWWLQKWFLWSVAALFLGGSIYLFYRLYCKRAKPEVPYWQKTLETIGLLEMSDLKKHKEFYAVVTSSLKDYLQMRFGVSMGGVTDDECLEKLKTNKAIPEWIYDDVKRMFNGIMFVKFANAHTGEQRMREDLSIFRKLVEQTKKTD